MNKDIKTLPHILVVDDTTENLQIVGEILNLHLACNLSFATDGKQALESVKDIPPDLILLDIMMPEMNGLEVCATLKRSPDTAAIPVLFLTAKAETSDLVAGLELGAADYVTKPFTAAELVARVKTQIHIRQAEAERMQLEIQNRQLQKAESLGRMAGAIAHNFNNQLQILLGNLELTAQVLQDGTDPTELVADAIQATKKAAELSGLMLTYLGHPRNKFDPVDLGEFCRLNTLRLQALLPPTVKLQTDLPDSRSFIQANASQIFQVLDQLVTNAQESFGTKPGVVHLNLRQVNAADVSTTNRFPPDWVPHHARYVYFEVTDTGGGIAANHIEKLFDPFFTTKFTGRGMGLPVVLGIVRAHGGVVCVASQPDHGTTVRVYLPEIDPPPAAPQ